jgi:hypothetical protein
MKTRNIPKTFTTIHDFGFKNLLVAGCSFTYNNSEDHSVTWPYYLRDMGGFETVLDCSMVGGGNQHIVNSVVYSIESYKVDPQDTLVVVQWAGHDRDDYIVDPTNINDYPFIYHYSKDAVAGITGGQDIANFNDKDTIQKVQTMKNHSCRSIENFVRIKSLHSYLENAGFKFVFFEYRDYTLPGRDSNFDPKPYLSTPAKVAYKNTMTVLSKNFYKYCLQNDLMEDDDFHPSPDGHLSFTKTVLLPDLINILD